MPNQGTFALEKSFILIRLLRLAWDMEASRLVSNERDEQMLKLSLVVIIHTGEIRCSSSFQHLGILEKFDPSTHR